MPNSEPTLPRFTSEAAQRAGRHSVDALVQALDNLHACGRPLMGQYMVLGGPSERAVGGQGVVQFVRRSGANEECAIKFFTYAPAFEAERALYEDTALRAMMPATREIVSNSDDSVRCGAYVFPPCIVQERGESLEEWAKREDRDYITTLQVRSDLQWCTSALCSCAFPPRWHIRPRYSMACVRLHICAPTLSRLC